MADRHPGRARELYGGARHQDRQRGVTLHCGRHGGERGRSLLGGDHLSGRQRHHPDSLELSGEKVRPQALLPDLSWTVHLKLAALRQCPESERAHAVPHSAGRWWRRHGTGRPVDPGGFVPPAKRGQAFALFGVAVVVAPVVGPTLGGWLSDNISWQWCFLVNVPVGVFAMAMIALLLREPKTARAERQSQQGNKFDVVGFILIATFLGALEVVLDRGLEDDWFGSPFIVTFATICGLAFVLMIPWEMSHRNPAVDLRMVASRQFGACFLVMLATGAILLATTQFLPQLVQQDFGYTATWAGLMLSPGGLVTMVMMFVVGRLAAKVQPKYLIVAGAVIVALSMYDMTNVYSDLGFWYMARLRMLFGIGLPMIFVPIMTASFDGIHPSKTDQASAIINAGRNTGSSIGVSIVSNVLTHREQFHQSRLVEQVIPSSPQYQDTLQHVTNYFTANGSSLAQAHDQAIQWIGQQVQIQASFLAYMDAFWVLMLISLSAVPLALALRKIKLGGPVHVGH